MAVGVAETGCFDLDEDLALAGDWLVDVAQLQGGLRVDEAVGFHFERRVLFFPTKLDGLAILFPCYLTYLLDMFIGLQVYRPRVRLDGTRRSASKHK